MPNNVDLAMSNLSWPVLLMMFGVLTCIGYAIGRRIVLYSGSTTLPIRFWLVAFPATLPLPLLYQAKELSVEDVLTALLHAGAAAAGGLVGYALGAYDSSRQPPGTPPLSRRR